MPGCIPQHPIYTNYEAKEDGTILNLKTGKNRKPFLHRTGYYQINVEMVSQKTIEFIVLCTNVLRNIFHLNFK